MKIKRKGWVNVYKEPDEMHSIGHLYDAKIHADWFCNRNRDRLACVPIEYEFDDGNPEPSVVENQNTGNSTIGKGGIGYGSGGYGGFHSLVYSSEAHALDRIANILLDIARKMK